MVVSRPITSASDETMGTDVLTKSLVIVRNFILRDTKRRSFDRAEVRYHIRCFIIIESVKTTRNAILHNIKRIQKEEKRKQFNEVIKEINDSKDDSRRMFKAIKEINRKKDNTIFVKNAEGDYVTSNKAKIDEISKHFKDVFQKGNIIPCPSLKPSNLRNPFTKNEIQKAISSLKNNKSGGCDLLRTEHLKFAPDCIIDEIVEL